MRILNKILPFLFMITLAAFSGSSLAEDDDTMGVTWVILIQNSEYASFDKITGPEKDITAVKSALEKYQVDNIVEKQNMSKKEMVKFFTTELKSLVKENKIKSLLIWFAGHGAILRQTGYWIPADAERSNVSSYFSGVDLQKAMLSYVGELQHTLIITEACNADSKFYTRAPEPMVIRGCTDGYGLGKRSAQSLSFSGYDKSLEDSRFTAKIAEILNSSTAECVPIEKLVTELTEEVFYKNRQVPNF